MSIPRLRFVAAITHPKQNANTFLQTQVHILNYLGETFPIQIHVRRIAGTKAKSIKEHAQTAALLPIEKMIIHNMLRAFDNPKNMWTLTLHTFLIKLQTLITAKAVYITAQIVKKYPGGVTYKWYLSDTSPVFIPTTQLTTNVAAKPKKLNSLIGHMNFPQTPRAQFIFYSSLSLLSTVNSSLIVFELLLCIQNFTLFSRIITNRNYIRKFLNIVKIIDYIQIICNQFNQSHANFAFRDYNEFSHFICFLIRLLLCYDKSQVEPFCSQFQPIIHLLFEKVCPQQLIFIYEFSRFGDLLGLNYF